MIGGCSSFGDGFMGENADDRKSGLIIGERLKGNKEKAWRFKTIFVREDVAFLRGIRQQRENCIDDDEKKKRTMKSTKC